MSRYIVLIRTCNAPKCNGGQYRRPVTVRVVDTLSGPSEWHWVRSGVVQSWRNVDSRYNGPRSACGQAVAAAHELAAQLNTTAQSVAA